MNAIDVRLREWAEQLDVQANGMTGDNRMGQLIVYDIDGRRTEYPVREIDLNAVIGFLKERNPRITVQAQTSI